MHKTHCRGLGTLRYTAKTVPIPSKNKYMYIDIIALFFQIV